MSTQCDELWVELLAAGKVRWMQGMACCSGSAAAIEWAGREPYRYIGGGNESDHISWRPIWDDPATLGCLTAMAREVTSSAMSVWRSTMTGEWGARHGPSVGVYTTEAETLLRVIKESRK